MNHTINDSFIAVTYRPFLDLGVPTTGLIGVYRVEYDAQDLMHEQRSYFKVQRLLAGSFREALVREAKLPLYEGRGA